MEDKLIAAGVKNLRAYGYPECDNANILTDQIYRAFFASMLRDNKGKAGAAVDKAIDNLLAKCETPNVGIEPTSRREGDSRCAKATCRRRSARMTG